MRRKSKRFFSAVLAGTMLLTMAPFSAFANEASNVTTRDVIIVDSSANSTNNDDNIYTNFASALEAAKDGDTIQLAAGTYTFTSGLSIGKAVNLEGVAGQTVIQGQVTYTVSATASDDDSITVSGITFEPAEGGSNHQGLCWANGSGEFSGYTLNVENCVFDGWQFAIGVNSKAVGCTLNVSDTQFNNTQVAMSVKTGEGNNNIGTLNNVTTTEGCYAVQAFGSNPSELNAYYNTVERYEADAEDDTLNTPDYNAAENGTPAFTTGTPVATVNGGFYDTLTGAVKAAKDGSTITLLKDVVVDGNGVGNNSGIVTFSSEENRGEKRITLDGNGFTLTAKNVSVDGTKGPSMINIQYGANVTIKDLTIDGFVSDTSATKHGVNVYDATATLENVTIKNGNGYGVVVNGSDVTVNGLTTENNDWGGINVDNTSGDASLVVNNATIKELNSIKFEKGGSGTDNISGLIRDGQFEYIVFGKDAADATSLTITGGVFNNETPSDEFIALLQGGSVANIFEYIPDGYIYNPYTGEVYQESEDTSKHSYAITTSVDKNGTVDVAPYVTEGDKVTVTITPDEGYMLDELTVKAGSKDIEVTDNEDGTYTFTMPSANVKITATFVEDPDYVAPEEPEEPSEPETPSMPFTDVNEGDWFYDVVQYAYDNGLMTGTSATTFEPNTSTTRGMIVAVLNRLEGGPTAEAAGFTDVNNGDWYADAVNWAASVGIVNGFEDNTFRANDPITREQMAAILYNYADYKGYDVSERADLSGYADADSISSWALDTLEWANAEGLITGMSADTIAPQGQATRAQVAAMFQRFLTAEK